MEFTIIRSNNESELYHYGVKGMKWGVRRYTNPDGTLTPAGIRKYAKAGYRQDAYNSNKSGVGRAYDRITGAHRHGGNMMYGAASNSQRKARAEKYLKDQNPKTAAKTGTSNKSKSSTKKTSSTSKSTKQVKQSGKSTADKYMNMGMTAATSYKYMQYRDLQVKSMLDGDGLGYALGSYGSKAYATQLEALRKDRQQGW